MITARMIVIEIASSVRPMREETRTSRVANTHTSAEMIAYISALGMASVMPSDEKKVFTKMEVATVSAMAVKR